jgi:hypothetical protein
VDIEQTKDDSPEEKPLKDQWADLWEAVENGNEELLDQLLVDNGAIAHDFNLALSKAKAKQPQEAGGSSCTTPANKAVNKP